MDLLVFGLVAAVLFAAVALVAVRRWFHAVGEHQALVVSRLRGAKVGFAPTLVLPVVQRAELMDLAVVKLEIDRRGSKGLICRDNIRADVTATFFVRVNKTAEDVLRVAQSVGAARASEPSVIYELFAAKFSEALETVAKQFDFEALYDKREEFRDAVLKVIGHSLSGYVLDDLALDYLEQTPIDQLDPSNILDAQGIRKIKTIAAEQRVRANEISQHERKEIALQDLAAEEAMAALDLQRQEAEAKRKREIEAIQARELRETLRVLIEEQTKVETALMQAKLDIAAAAAKREDVVAAVRQEIEKQAMENLRSHSVIDKYLIKVHDTKADVEARLAALEASEPPEE